MRWNPPADGIGRQEVRLGQVQEGFLAELAACVEDSGLSSFNVSLGMEKLVPEVSTTYRTRNSMPKFCVYLLEGCSDAIAIRDVRRNTYSGATTRIDFLSELFIAGRVSSQQHNRIASSKSSSDCCASARPYSGYNCEKFGCHCGSQLLNDWSPQGRGRQLMHLSALDCPRFF